MPELTQGIEQLHKTAGKADGLWGISVYAPLRKEQLYQVNSHNNFRCASNMKILTSQLCFQYLGPEYRFQTQFGYTGTLNNQILSGNLIVIGGGDPSSGHDQLQPQVYFSPLITLLKKQGIEEIQGDLIAQISFFDGKTIPGSWEWGDMGYYYANPISPLCYGNARTWLSVSVDEEGQTHTSFVPDYYHRFSVAPGQLSHNWTDRKVQVERIWGTEEILLKGNLPPCSLWTEQMTSWHPELQYLDNLRFALEKAGIRVSGIQRSEQKTDQDFKFLALLESEPLATLCIKLMKESDNNYANMILKTLAKEIQGEGSFEKATELATQYLRELAPTDAEGFSLVDGAGMSSQNYLSPSLLQALLSQGPGEKWFPQWFKTFPIMGVDGSLKERALEQTDIRGRVWAKTGYINRARSLSGYLETSWGEPLIFSIMVNNYSGRTREIDKVIDQICSLLVKLQPSEEVRNQAEKLYLFSGLTQQD